MNKISRFENFELIESVKNGNCANRIMEANKSLNVNRNS